MSILTGERTHRTVVRVGRNAKKYRSHKKNAPRGKKTIMDDGQYRRDEDREIIFKPINRDEAKGRIRRYVTRHPGSLTSEIIESLAIDPIMLVDILEELKSEGLVLSQAVE